MLVAAILLRHKLEQFMSFHMLMHIPIIMLAGVLLSHGLFVAVGKPEHFLGNRSFNMLGITGLTFASITSTYWMIPKALDHVLVSPYAVSGKFISVFLAGLLLYGSWRLAHTVIRVFFLGGFCWMLAMVGLLYQDSTQRLCNYYLLSDQEWAGRGLVILSVVLPLIWLATEVSDYKRIKKELA